MYHFQGTVELIKNLQYNNKKIAICPYIREKASTLLLKKNLTYFWGTFLTRETNICFNCRNYTYDFGCSIAQ